jgi:hypothetical protein
MRFVSLFTTLIEESDAGSKNNYGKGPFVIIEKSRMADEI